MKKIELLAPAGTKEAFYAAVNNGADAVYIGGKNFGARAYAQNFTNEEICELITYAHVRGVKVYVTINTIVFDSEWDELTSFLDFLYQTDVDALIVQDLGVMEYISKHYPSFTIHASTQVNVHSVNQAKTLQYFNVKRIVLAREVNLPLAKSIKDQTNLEIEVFAHGALCICYSGNCLMSSFIGKRSGNRGKCAQACRLPYKLGNNPSEKHYLSTKDLITLEYLDKIIESGIDSLKIEGRMKSPEYVAITTNIYRQAIDSFYDGKSFDINQAILELQTAFNRQFTKGYLLDENNYSITNIESPNHQGILIGQVIGSKGEYLKIKLTYPLNIGDSIRIVGKESFGFTITKMKDLSFQDIKNASKECFILSNHIVNNGALVYLTKSIKQTLHTEETIKSNYKKIACFGKVSLQDNKLKLEITDGKNTVCVLSKGNVEKAERANITNERIFEQINKLGNTPYYFKNLTIDLPFAVFLPIKEINELRRQAIEELSYLRSKWNIRKPKIASPSIKPINVLPIEYSLKAKVTTEEQLQAVIEIGFQEIYVSNLELIHKYQKQYPKIKFVYYYDRIAQESFDESIPYVSSNIGLLNDKTLASSIYLNVVNSYAVYYLLTKGVKIVGLSLEMSKEEIINLINNFKNRYGFIPNLELNCYGYQEMMIMRHDLLGKNNINGNQSYLIDRKDYTFPVLKIKNVTKILNSKRLHLIDYLDEIKQLGIRSCYLDFTIEDYKETKEIAKMYYEKYYQKIDHSLSLRNSTYGHYRDGVL